MKVTVGSFDQLATLPIHVPLCNSVEAQRQINAIFFAREQRVGTQQDGKTNAYTALMPMFRSPDTAFQVMAGKLNPSESEALARLVELETKMRVFESSVRKNIYSEMILPQVGSLARLVRMTEAAYYRFCFHQLCSQAEVLDSSVRRLRPGSTIQSWVGLEIFKAAIDQMHLLRKHLASQPDASEMLSEEWLLTASVQLQGARLRISKLNKALPKGVLLHFSQRSTFKISPTAQVAA